MILQKIATFKSVPIKKFICLLLALFISQQASAAKEIESSLPKGFVYLADIDSTIMQKLGFATSNNILGVPAEGYETGRAICTKKVAFVLRQIQQELKKEGLSLCVWDAYRPQRAVDHIKRWAQDLTDQKTKARYYPHMDKKEILGTLVAANRSSHSRGSTVDLIIVDGTTKQSLDFGPDGFGEVDTYCSKLTPDQQKNRLFLRDVMVAHGFKPYDKEFWHFTLKNEPFPDTYFDFPIQ